MGGQAGKTFGIKMNPDTVKEMHQTFIDAPEQATPSLEAWKRLCDILAETANIYGGIDAPVADSGERATHRAAELGRVQNLEWLLRNGADVNAATAPAHELSAAGDMSLGLSPAHVAAAYGQV